MKITVFGGDMRQVAAARQLEKAGYAVDTVGLEKTDLNNYATVNSCSFCNTDAILFPLPFSKDGENIFSPLSEEKFSIEDTVKKIKPGTEVFTGLLNKYQRSLFGELRLEVFDYYDLEEFQVKNSVPTAEGAMMLYAEKSRKTVWQSRIAVVGFGKVGKTLAERLAALGAQVVVVARNPRDLAVAECMGCEGKGFEAFDGDCGGFDCIFNTVPHNIFDEENVLKFDDKALFVELASKPFGITPSAIQVLGERFVPASSLPGKFFPETAGKIIAETVLNRLK